MPEIGVQTKNIIDDNAPLAGFQMIKQAGFTCCDFSLNDYLKNKTLYDGDKNQFFDADIDSLIKFFTPHKLAAEKAGIRIGQMHMPYPAFIPTAKKELNDYLWNQMVPKSMEICEFFECPNIVIHGFKLTKTLGSEAAEWEKTKTFLEYLAPMAKKAKTVVCMENLWNTTGTHKVEGPGCDALKAAKRIDELNEKFGEELFGFCFDTGHANLVGLDFEKFLKTLGHRLKVLHIHDNDGLEDLHQIPFTFTRIRTNKPSTDWEGFLKGLKAIDYKGVLSFETGPCLDTFPEELKADALRLIARIGEYFSAALS